MLKKLFGKNKKGDDTPDIKTPTPSNDDKTRVRNQIYRNLAVPVAYEKDTVKGQFVDKIDDECPMMNEDEAGFHLFGAESQNVWDECEEYEAFVVNTDLKDTIKFMKKNKCVDFIVLCRGNKEVKFTFKEMCNIAGYDPADFDATETPAMSGGGASSTRFIGKAPGTNRVAQAAMATGAAAASGQQSSNSNDDDLARENNDSQSIFKFLKANGTYVARIEGQTDWFVSGEGDKKCLLAAETMDDIAIYFYAHDKDAMDKIQIGQVPQRDVMKFLDDNNHNMIFIWGSDVKAQPAVMPKMCNISRAGVETWLEREGTLEAFEANKELLEYAMKLIVDAKHVPLLCADSSRVQQPVKSVKDLICMTVESHRGAPCLKASFTDEQVQLAKSKYPDRDMGIVPVAVDVVMEALQTDLYSGIWVETDRGGKILPWELLCAINSELVKKPHCVRQRIVKNAEDDKAYQVKVVKAYEALTDIIDVNIFTSSGNNFMALYGYCAAGCYVDQSFNQYMQNFDKAVEAKHPDSIYKALIDMAYAVSEKDASITKEAKAKIDNAYRVSQRQKLGFGDLVFLKPSEGSCLYEANVWLYRALTNDHEVEMMTNVLKETNMPAQDIEKYINLVKGPYCGLLNEWLAAISTKKMRTSSLVKINGIDIRATAQIVKEQNNQLNEAMQMHLGYLMMLDMALGDTRFVEYTQARMKQYDKFDADMEAQRVSRFNQALAMGAAASTTIPVSDLPADFRPRNPQPVNNTARPTPMGGGKMMPGQKLPMIVLEDGWTQRKIFTRAMEAGIVDMGTNDVIGALIVPKGHEYEGKMMWGWKAMTREDYDNCGYGEYMPKRQTTTTMPQPSGKVYDVLTLGKVIDDYPHNKCDNEEILTYRMANGQNFTFKAIDLKRAERSILVECLTKLSMDKDQATDALLYLYPYVDIMLECGQFMMGIKPSNPISVEGYTAEKLMQTTYLSNLGAYNYLVYLRKNPAEALDNLRNGLPTY